MSVPDRSGRYDHSEEIREDIRHFHGERFAPRTPPEDYVKSIRDAIAKYNTLTPEEHAELQEKVQKRMRGEPY